MFLFNEKREKTHTDSFENVNHLVYKRYLKLNSALALKLNILNVIFLGPSEYSRRISRTESSRSEAIWLAAAVV